LTVVDNIHLLKYMPMGTTGNYVSLTTDF